MMKRIYKITATLLVILMLISNVVFVLPQSDEYGILKVAAQTDDNESIEIYTAEDFYNIRNNLDGNYILKNNIDLSSYSNWEPIGFDAPFTGTVNGNGFCVKGMKIDTTVTLTNDGEKVTYGLFGSIKGGTVEFLGLENATVKCHAEGPSGNVVTYCHVALFTGEFTDSTIIAGCYATGTITADATGQVAIRTSPFGSCIGSGIGYCYSDATISASSNCQVMAGGICSWLDVGVIQQCYARGSINTDSDTYTYVGGICGSGSNGRITSCVALQSSYSINAGILYSDAICITHQLVTCLSNSMSANSLSNRSATVISDGQSCSQSTYEDIGWSFENIWKINPLVNSGYPYLPSNLQEDIPGGGVQEENKAIIVVPGITGSELYGSTLDGGYDKIWIGTGITALDILKCNEDGSSSPTVLPYQDQNANSFGTIGMYTDIVNGLKRSFGKENGGEYDVIFFAYDWRLTNSNAAKNLKKTIDDKGYSSVILVCHSMGGIVASKYIADYGFNNIEKLITLGTPYYGAPKAIYAFETGLFLDGIAGKVSSGLIKALIPNMPGVYQLIPNPRYYGAGDYCVVKLNDLDEDNELTDTVWSGYINGKEPLFFSETTDFLQYRDWFNSYVYNNYFINFYGGSNIYNSYDKIINSSANSDLDAYVIVGYNNETLTCMDYSVSTGVIEDVDINMLGDGTVPIISSTFADADMARKPYYVNSVSHTNLANDSDVLNLIGDIIDGNGDNSPYVDGTKISRAITTKKTFTGFKIIAACPVSLTAYDSSNNWIGTISTKEYDWADGHYYDFYRCGENNETKIAFLDDMYHDLVISGSDVGTMDFAIEKYENDVLVESLVYTDVPITDTTVIDTNTDMTEDAALKVDVDNDAVYDFDIYPDHIIHATSIEIEESAVDICVGETTTIVPTMTPENATIDILWHSSDETVVQVSDGVITAVGEGTATITAYTADGECSATCEITVNPAKAESITLNCIEAALTPDETMTINAVANPIDATNSIIWSTSDPRIATVDENGTVTAHALGTAIITATAGDVSATCTVTVVAPLDKPTNLNAYTFGYTSIKMTWDAVEGADGYEIFRCDRAGQPYNYVDSVSADAGETAYRNIGLSTGTTYYYKVRAYKTLEDGTKLYSDLSAYSSARPLPAMPVITAVRTSATTANISWVKIYGATGYSVYYSTEENGTYKFLANLKSGDTTTYKATGLASAKTYYYKVRAYRQMGDDMMFGSYSKPAAAFGAPAVPTITARSVGYTSAKVLWEPVKGADGYAIYRCDVGGGAYSYITSVGADVTTYTNTGLSTGTTYYYKVRAYADTDGGRLYGNYSACATARPIPATPVVTVTADDANNATISWVRIYGATGYSVYRSTEKDGTYSFLAGISSGDTVSYTDKNTDEGVTYYYKVRAYRQMGKDMMFGEYSKPAYVK